MTVDLLDELNLRQPSAKKRRPDPDMCLFLQGCRKCSRILRSWSRGRIGAAEARRRCRRNYLRTGAYMGPVGWADAP